jgi:hypothetical protein
MAKQTSDRKSACHRQARKLRDGALAERYGNCQTHPRSHIDVWARLEPRGLVPHGSEYEDYPRGRVAYHPATGESTILADRCILEHKGLVAQIKQTLHLRKKAKLGTDPHYGCPCCLRGKQASGGEDREE